MNQDEDKERIALQSIEIHSVPFGENVDYSELHFPIDSSQVNDLLGQILTQIEAMNLSEKSENANKAIFKQMIWHWFDEVMDNSWTSSNGCIAPIKIVRCSCDGGMSQCSDCSVKSPIKLFRVPKN